MNSLVEDLNTHPETTYRVVVREGRPADDFAVVLTPVNPADDPGDPLPGIGTTRYKFDADKLQQFEPWKTLLASIADLDIRRAADLLLVDTRAPAASLSFAEPGPVEVALLTRAREEVGAGRRVCQMNGVSGTP